ncbi:outer membrane protein assembly factor BamA [Buchnera aphidicola]|uniref:Outer membrane protein assembly factor BamA n=1 Tax=Buchnera aphidicola (Cinara cf. splendens/pseudotsugae 3390) TaxID=2518980 RepID=A0A451CWL3_9GAMM|nr:outer membrane protein assembly factor BamA [Buchnera aphidicola]VFP77727.1 Outer membrane protein assembly factor BamA [Buchnera aphidicola (Cinara cf. splendens/pseudotsugae 3390)]
MLYKKFFFICCMVFSFSVSASKVQHIKRVSICGIKNISKNSILRTLQSNFLKKRTLMDVSNVVLCLRNTNRFIKVNATKFNDTLILLAQEFPEINKISYFGINHIKTKNINILLKKFNLIEKGFFCRVNCNNFFSILKKKYEYQGYLNAKFRLIVIRNTNNTVQLKIIVDEGIPSIISRIDMNDEGNFFKKKMFTDISISKTNLLWNFFSIHQYNSIKFKNLLRELHFFYIRHGYLDFKIKSVQKYCSTDKKNIVIKINVYTGSQYYIKHVLLRECDKLYNYSIIDQVQKKISHSLYSESTLNQAKMYFKHIYLPLGISNTRLFFHSEINKNNHSVRLYIGVDVLKPCIVNNVYFSRNSNISSKFINCYTHHSKHDFFNENYIIKSCKNLFQTGLFNRIQVYAEKHINNSGKIDIFYSFKVSANTRTFNISTNYGKDRGLLLQLLLLDKNLIGTGSELYVKILKNFADTDVKIHLLKPVGFLKNFFLKSDMFYNFVHKRYFFAHKYIDRLFGFSSSLYTSNLKHKKFSVSFEYEKIKIICKTPYITLYQYFSSLSEKLRLKPKISDFFVNDFFIKYIFDFNNIKGKDFLKKGCHAKFIGKFTLPFSDNFYHKLFFNVNQYVPLKNIYDSILHNFLEFGTGFTSGKYVFPFYENYKFYNKKTKSGFQDNSIGPTAVYYEHQNDLVDSQKYQNSLNLFPSTKHIGGNILVHANTELLFPNIHVIKKIFNMFQAGLFLDAVNIWDTSENNTIPLYLISNANNIKNSDSAHISVGAFIRWISCFGPLTFYASAPLHPYNTSNNCLDEYGMNFS